MSMAATGGAGARCQQRRTRAEDVVLTFKITAPAVPKWAVPRERVKELIATGAAGPLTVVTGPAGAGKTVALALWAKAGPRPGPAAWITLDRFDNRPEIFWSYVTEALRGAGVAISPKLPALATRQPDLFLHQFASALATQDPAVALIMDDFHVLTDPRCLDGLAYVLKNASPGFRLLVASRMDPLLPLHHYRLTGELTEIRAEDLAFTESEAGLLMAKHGITLPPESLAILTWRDEGWAAGLRLAAVSLADHADPEQYVKELAAEDGAIAGYLVNEVLNIQSADVRDVLLKTSILDRVNVELAGELAGNGKAAEAIPALARANAFVEPIGHGWYRYHSLFADVLRLKLRHESPHKITLLHRRAARWLWRNGSLPEAVSQAAAAGDWPLAARMAVEGLAVGPLLRARAGEPLAAACKDIPAAAEFQEPPPLIVAAAMALRDGQYEVSTASLREAERLLEPIPAGDEVPSRFAATLVRMDLGRRSGDLSAAAGAAAQAAVLLGRMPADLLSRHSQVHAQVLSGRALGEILAGRLDGAASLLEQGAAVTGDPGEWADCVGRRALLEAVRGRLHRAGKLAATACAPPGHGRAIGWQPSAAAEVALAWVHLERNQLRDAAASLSRAEDALHAQPDRLIGAVAWLVVARHNLARRRAGTAVEMISRARRGWSPPPWFEERLALAESHSYAAAGDIQAALDAAGHAGAPSSLAAAVALARTWLAAGDVRAAAQALASAAATPASETPGHIRLEAELIAAELGYRDGNPGRGRQSLARALKIAQAERLLLPIAMQRAWIEPALRRDPSLTEAFRRLFEPAMASPARARAPAESRPAPLLVERLSDRELEVLCHVARMLSTAEIAEEMYLSGNTVKSHLKSIFRKLGASHRGEAVRRARELGMLG